MVLSLQLTPWPYVYCLQTSIFVPSRTDPIELSSTLHNYVQGSDVPTWSFSRITENNRIQIWSCPRAHENPDFRNEDKKENIVMHEGDRGTMFRLSKVSKGFLSSTKMKVPQCTRVIEVLIFV